jgi:ferredoxin
MDIAEMNRLVEAGKDTEALRLLRDTLVIPATLCYICNAPCEKICRRGQIDKAVEVREIKKRLVNNEKEIVPPAKAPSKGKKIAVDNSSPAGLAIAYELMCRGYDVTVVESKGAFLSPYIDKEKAPDEIIQYELKALELSGLHLNLSPDPLNLSPDPSPQGRGEVVADNENPTQHIQQINPVQGDVQLTPLPCGEGLGERFDVQGDVQPTPLPCGEGLGERFDVVINVVQGDVQPTPLPCGEGSGERFDVIINVVQGDVQPTPLPCGEGLGERFTFASKIKQPARQIEEGRAFADRIDRILSSANNQSENEQSPVKRFNSTFPKLTEKEIDEYRKSSLTGHSTRCLYCDCNSRTNCRLRDAATANNCKGNTYNRKSSRIVSRTQINDAIYHEPAKCISCGLCVYNIVNGFAFSGRGFEMQVILPQGNEKNITPEIAELCPTGSLSEELRVKS